MTSSVHLENSFTFVTPTVMKEKEKPRLNEETFAAAAEHLIIEDEALAKAISSLAMQEMGVVKLPVGINSHAERVEFFWLDVKKNKKAVDRINKLLAKRWVQLIWKFEETREDCNGNMLSARMNDAAADIEAFIKLRRFLLTGTDPEFLKKGKRSILLFHHSEVNAPQLE